MTTSKKQEVATALAKNFPTTQFGRILDDGEQVAVVDAILSGDKVQSVYTVAATLDIPSHVILQTRRMNPAFDAAIRVAEEAVLDNLKSALINKATCLVNASEDVKELKLALQVYNSMAAEKRPQRSPVRVEEVVDGEYKEVTAEPKEADEMFFPPDEEEDD